MAIKSRWDSENHGIYHIEFESQWSVEDLSQAWAGYRMWLDDAKHTIHLIVDFSRTQMVPPGITGVFGQTSELFSHPNTGLIFAVGASLAIKTFAQIFLKLFSQFSSQILFVTSLEEAHAFITQEQDMQRVPRPAHYCPGVE